MGDFLDQLHGVTVASFLAIVAITLVISEGVRRYISLRVDRSFKSSAGEITRVLSEHEGRLAEHLERLERLRADQALTEGRVRKALVYIDELRDARKVGS